MAFVTLNTYDFDKRYAISSETWTNANLVSNWLMKNVGSSDFDFIGPSALNNLAIAALQIGLSFNKPMKVLIINIDNSKCARDFFEEIKRHAHPDVSYHFINAVNGEFVSDNLPNIKWEFKNIPTTFKDEVGEKPMENRNNDSQYQGMPKTLTWDEAKAYLQKSSAPVRRLSMDPNHFVGYNRGKELEAEKFWIPSNRKAAERNGGTLNVLPYYAYCDGKSVDMAWRPTMQDELATDWVLANNHLTLCDLEQTPSGNYRATYLLQPGEINTSGSVLFPIYDMIYKKEVSEFLIVTCDLASANVLSALISDMKEKLYNKEATITASTTINLDKPEPPKADLVDITFTLPGTNKNKKPDVWDQESFYEELEKALIANPNLNLILNLKGIAEDPVLLNDIDMDKCNDYAVNFVNYIYNRLKKFSDDYPNNWLIVDLDEETREDF